MTRAPAPRLSCYTTALVGHLRRADPGADSAFAAAVRLSVRIDTPVLAFRHHGRVDPGLGYRGAETWAEARAGIAADLDRDGDVVVVASTRSLPWCPGEREAPHWLRVTGRAGDRWRVRDEFAALLLDGEQRPWSGTVTGAELAELLRPLPALPAEVHQRDVHALGEAVRVPAAGRYRWLSRNGDGTAVTGGEWVHGTEAALRVVAERLAADPEALGRHAEDLWAAARHHQAGAADRPAAVAAWGELVKSVRFAVQSARRGRPRPSLVALAFDRLIAATTVPPR